MRQSRIQKRLGYSLDTKLLIIHADDTGLCTDQNKATFNLLDTGKITSTSIMVPCEAFSEGVNYAKKNQDSDFGIHLTITSEWQNYKWKPLLPPEEVPTIINDDGYFFGHDFYKYVNVSDVKKELCEQINKAIREGITPTHLDCHMNCLLLRQDLFECYLELSEVYNIPILINKQYLSYFQLEIPKTFNGEIIYANEIFIASANDENKYDHSDFYVKALREIKAGLSIILIHPSYNTPEMQIITDYSTNWGAKWRQVDHDFFYSEECSKIIQEENIQLITWREIKSKLFSKEVLC